MATTGDSVSFKVDSASLSSQHPNSKLGQTSATNNDSISKTAELPSQPKDNAVALPSKFEVVPVVAEQAAAEPAGHEQPKSNPSENIDPLSKRDDKTDDHLALYQPEEDGTKDTPLGAYLRAFTAPGTAEKEAAEKKKSKKLGTILGVYLPTIQHIFGVLMFLRLFWIVGCMGVVESFFMVFMCCCCTFLTSISMSAIATNGVVESGGSYFMISRNLGPEMGSAVGILFYLANTVATSMYLVGAVEFLLVYMLPTEARVSDDQFNNFRLYGTGLLLVVFGIVWIGVRFVQCFAPISLACVLIAILSIYVGSFVANPDDSVKICLMGDHLLKSKIYMWNGTNYCNSAGLDTGPIRDAICNKLLETYNKTDPDYDTECERLVRSEYRELREVPGIPGYGKGELLRENAYNLYMQQNETVPGVPGKRYEVVQDMATTFFTLMAIYFPSVTGIMTGSNMSGDLKDPQKSIPIGTIAAQFTTSIVYLSFTIVFGGTIHGALLRDKYGESIDDRMVAAQLVWPNEWVLLVGSFLSTFGAALQCLCSAPRLLQSIAKDDVIPFLSVFAVVNKRKEPHRALYLSVLIAECAVLIGNIDLVAPIVDFFFLFCYFFVNIVCALQTILRAPNWRPRFWFYHWSLSLLGAVICLAIMISTHWEYAIINFVLCFLIYKYVQYYGGKKEWGDGLRGLALSTAQYGLLYVEDTDPHPKNWRPQLLLLMKPDDNLNLKHQRMLTLASQLKAGKGLTIALSLMEGEHSSLFDKQRADDLLQTLRKGMVQEKCRGFAKVIVTENPLQSISAILQAIGVGGLKPNTVMMGFPQSWQEALESGNDEYWQFIESIHRISISDMLLLIAKGLDTFPDSEGRMEGSIDVWWIMHDGGLLILLPFLLKQHKVWRNCPLRVFAVARMKDNSIKMKEQLHQWCYQLRIDAKVEIIELTEEEISPYTHEKTMVMEQREKYLRQLRLSKQEQELEPQFVLDNARSAKDGLEKVTVGSQTTDSVKEASKLTSTVPKETKRVEIREEAGMDTANITNPSEMEKEVGKGSETSQAINGRLSNLYARPSIMYSKNTSQSTGEGILEEMLEREDNVEKRKELADKIHERNLKKMHTAVSLNKIIQDHSSTAQLVVLNLPKAPRSRLAFPKYLEYLEVLTAGLDRVLLTRGTDKEVITVYS